MFIFFTCTLITLVSDQNIYLFSCTFRPGSGKYIQQQNTWQCSPKPLTFRPQKGPKTLYLLTSDQPKTLEPQIKDQFQALCSRNLGTMWKDYYYRAHQHPQLPMGFQLCLSQPKFVIDSIVKCQS